MRIEKETDERERKKLRILCGFDGFVDTLVRPVKTAEPGGNSYFETIEEFGQYLISKAGKSCSIRLDTSQRRIGGNALIFAKAAAQLGEEITCIGAMGEKGSSTIFKELEEMGNFLSIAEPGQSTAMEFQDGKILLAQSSDLDCLDYERVKERIGEEQLRTLFQNADVIALLNWSELERATQLWRGLLENCFPKEAAGEKRVLVDLCDCSAKTGEQLEEIFRLLQEFSEYAEVLLTLNENEAEVLGRHFELEAEAPCELVRALYHRLKIQNVIIHAIGYACGANAASCEYVPVQPVEMPVISTGAGDYFNSGLAVSWGRGAGLRQALELANKVTCFYVSAGIGPALEDLEQNGSPVQ